MLIQKNRQELLQKIVKVILNYYSIPVIDFAFKSRKQKVVLGRHLIFYFSLNYFDFTIYELADYFNFDRTSILHGNKAIKNYLFYDKEIKDQVSELMGFLT